MQYVQLGARGPRVSTVGFGAWAIGGMDWGPTDDDVSKRALHAALDAGVTLLDTADVYGRGHSEELIAAVLAERKSRDGVVIATKAGNDFYNAKAEDDHGFGPILQSYDKDYILFAAEQSLKRLKVERLDILQLHSGDLVRISRPDPWEALAQLKRQGKIGAAGWSVQSFQETAQADVVDQYHEVLDVLQVRYNVLEREAEKVLFPKAQQYGIGVIARIPLLFGLLTGKFDRHATFGPDDHRRMNLSPEKLHTLLARLDACAPFYETFPKQSKSQISLRFCLSHPACQTVIPGAKTPQQVADNVAASDLGPLPQEVLQLLEETS
jgi:aryl-alcohol dehydrogenase-like predicted oxidoreductase